jgi:site-specific DNA-adenine methylase
MLYTNSPLKWAGDKMKLLPHLLPILEKHRKGTFVEPLWVRVLYL